MVRAAAADADFDHLSIMVDTLLTPQGRDEFQSTDVPTILHRLFHQDALVLTQISAISFFCGCSREGVGAMLRSLGREELAAAQRDGDEPGYVAVRCEFCGAQYRFDAVDVEQLLLDDSVSPPDSTLH
jgi:molecular chaperone Hsp33